MPLIIPFFVPEPYRLMALVAMVCLSLFSGYSISPFYSTWIANAVPENIRARFSSRQTITSTIVAMVAGFAIGQFLDLFPADGKERGFIWVFAIGSIFGLIGYLNLLRAPFPQHSATTAEQGARLGDLLQPFHDSNFRRAVLFFGLWTFGLGLAGPLYSVFMLDRLQISYTEISIFNALFMLTSIAGYRIWAGLIDRFGSKPILQILMTPAAFLPFLWAFNNPDSYYLVPIALVLGGILFSGIGVGINPLLYDLLPQGQKRTIYLATWSVSVNLMGPLGPLLGGILVFQLKDLSFSALGVSMGNLQVVFALSALTRLVPLIILRTLDNAKGTTSRSLLSQMRRGNVLSYAYNASIFSLTTASATRAPAAEALGRSGTPPRHRTTGPGLSRRQPPRSPQRRPRPGRKRFSKRQRAPRARVARRRVPGTSSTTCSRATTPTASRPSPGYCN
ncbi:MAG: MFS transporter, partial [Candidatus Latescibacterota bacterium]|nr:MFS transporter [Candidatus Latescibacterota bacterium]